MKVIDLYNLVANDEELPEKIKLKDFEEIYTLREDCTGYKWYGEEKEHKEFSDIIHQNLEYVLKQEVEIIEEEKELHANDIEFNINYDKRDCIITLDENDLGIDKLHLDNCYFYKENDKWYVKHINLKPIAYISQEHKIPEKIKDKYCSQISKVKLAQKYNEIIDYLKEKE